MPAFSMRCRARMVVPWRDKNLRQRAIFLEYFILYIHSCLEVFIEQKKLEAICPLNSEEIGINGSQIKVKIKFLSTYIYTKIELFSKNLSNHIFGELF